MGGTVWVFRLSLVSSARVFQNCLEHECGQRSLYINSMAGLGHQCFNRTYLSYGEKKEIGDSFRNKNSQLKNLHEAYYHD